MDNVDSSALFLVREVTAFHADAESPVTRRRPRDVCAPALLRRARARRVSGRVVRRASSDKHPEGEAGFGAWRLCFFTQI